MLYNHESVALYVKELIYIFPHTDFLRVYLYVCILHTHLLKGHKSCYYSVSVICTMKLLIILKRMRN